MATFQELRNYLETHYDELVLSLSEEYKAAFQGSFEGLQRDWNQNIGEGTMFKVTLREMRKYPTVWKELEAAHLVLDEQRNTPAPTPSSVPIVSRANAASTPPSQADGPPNNGQPSQSIADRLAIWDKRIAIGKELLTGLMGIAIVVVTLAIAILTINSVSNQATYAAAKDILLFMNGLVGVVLGYYFGRVPADARADKAENETKTANSNRDQILSTVRTVLDESSRSLDRSTSAGGVNLTSTQVDSLRNVLRQYDR